MKKLTKAMQNIDEHFKDDDIDQEVKDSWKIIKDDITEMLGRIIELDNYLSEEREIARKYYESSDQIM